jgi:hypothetical protein
VHSACSTCKSVPMQQGDPHASERQRRHKSFSLRPRKASRGQGFPLAMTEFENSKHQGMQQLVHWNHWITSLWRPSVSTAGHAALITTAARPAVRYLWCIAASHALGQQPQVISSRYHIQEAICPQFKAGDSLQRERAQQQAVRISDVIAVTHAHACTNCSRCSM